MRHGHARVLQRRGRQHQLARGFEPRGEVGKPEADRLMLEDRLAEAGSFACVAGGARQRGLRHADALRRDADAPGFQVGECDAVAGALRAQAQSLLYEEVFEPDGAGVRRRLPSLCSTLSTR